MNWNRGFSASYELRKVDPVTFRDTDTLDFTAGTISRTGTGLMESADLTMTENPGECLVRVYLQARQGEDSEHVALFTGLTSTPSRTLDGRRETYAVECFSVLKGVADILIPRGYYAPAGADAAHLAKSLLDNGPAPVVVDGESPALVEAVVAEDTQSLLDVAWLILNAIGWRIRITGDGTVHICPAAAEPVAVFDSLENDSVELAVTDKQDWFSVPNCIRVTSGNKYVEFKDEESSFSVNARKALRGGSGEIWMSDSASAIGTSESLAEYAVRLLKEAQAPARALSYPRRFRPEVLVTDIVTLHYPGIGIDGRFKVTSQRIELGYGCRTSEEVTAVE